jgi:hypothetical protein
MNKIKKLFEKTFPSIARWYAKLSSDDQKMLVGAFVLITFVIIIFSVLIGVGHSLNQPVNVKDTTFPPSFFQQKSTTETQTTVPLTTSKEQLNAQEVYIVDALQNSEDYRDKWIKVSFPIYDVSYDEYYDETEFSFEVYEYDIYEKKPSPISQRISLDGNYSHIKTNSYVTVVIKSDKYYIDTSADVFLITSGDSAKRIYESQKKKYDSVKKSEPTTAKPAPTTIEETEEETEKVEKYAMVVFIGSVGGDKIHIHPDCRSFKYKPIKLTLKKAKSQGHKKWCGICSKGWSDEEFYETGNPYANDKWQ